MLISARSMEANMTGNRIRTHACTNQSIDVARNFDWEGPKLEKKLVTLFW